MPFGSRETYRERIYGRYDSGRKRRIAATEIGELKKRLENDLGNLVKRHFPLDRTCSILDLGCGHGALLYALQCNGYINARGVDTSPEQIAAASRLGVAGVEHGDVVECLSKVSPGSLDVIVTYDVIEHFRKDELLPLVDAIFNALRSGGRWIIHVPNGEGPFSGAIRYGDFTHELAFTRISLDQLLRASGFAEVSCFEDRPILHGVKSTVRAILWELMRLVLLMFCTIETGRFDREAIFSRNMLAIATKA